LAAEFASNADERQLAKLLDGNVAFEYLLNERIFALRDQCSQRRVKRIVVFLNKLRLQLSIMHQFNARHIFMHFV